VCNSQINSKDYYSFGKLCTKCPSGCVCDDYGCSFCSASTNRLVLGGKCACKVNFAEILGKCVCVEPNYLDAANNCTCMEQILKCDVCIQSLGYVLLQVPTRVFM
jgi:hypothetical protein